MSPVDQLPRTLRVLWDLEPKPTRSTGPALSRERIVRAAIELVDEQGMDALSMARLAERLGCATMSLYRHVASKDELQAVMLDAGLAEPPRQDDPNDNWRAGLETWARTLLAVYLRHPWMPRMEITGPPLSPGQLGWLEAGLVLLHDTALQPIERMSVMLLVAGYVRTEATMAIVGDEVRRDVGPDSARETVEQVAKLIDPQRFPALSEIVESGAFTSAPFDFDHFTYGLRLILDAIAVRANHQMTGP
ncbi:TetR-family transcriptional regulator [Kutzneria sp. 744]|nr:TetR-family transcriptional regulator [Kutzneria sp. 744]